MSILWTALYIDTEDSLQEQRENDFHLEADQLSVLTHIKFRCPFHPRVIAVARKSV